MSVCMLSFDVEERFRVYPYPVFHPWELDAGQPRVGGLGRGDRCRQYHGPARTEAKLCRFLGDFAGEPIGDGVRRRLAAAARERSAA